MTTQPDSGTILELQSVTKRFGSIHALADVSLSVARGETLGILGPSGSGKSTLLRCIDLITGIDAGAITYTLPNTFVASAAVVRTNKGPVDPAVVRRSLGLVFQHFSLWPERSVRDNLTLAPVTVLRESKTEVQERARAMADRFDIADKLDARVWALSGGQKPRVAIARALMMRPRLLLLDEVTSALDPMLSADIMAVIKSLRDDGTTMLLVTHHVGFAARTCDRLVFLDRGRVVEMGPAGQIVSNPQSDVTRRFLDVLTDVR
jgi:polar amino acid transport system ATP-binding protein